MEFNTMGLGIISDDDFFKELKNSSIDNNTTNTTNNTTSPDDLLDGTVITSNILPMNPQGRHNDVNNVPQSLRKILGEEVATNGLSSAMRLADSFGGISQPTLSTYGTGQVSRGIKSNKSDDMYEYVNGRKTKITKRALNKLNLAMSLMDETKLMGCDAKELSTVAKDMAQIVKHMEPSKQVEEIKEAVQFHFYAPQVRNENHYETVVAKDNY